MTDRKLSAAADAVSGHMDAILRCFRPGAKITVLVRSPNGEREPGARDFVMTNDELPEVAAMVARRIGAAPQPPSGVTP